MTYCARDKCPLLDGSTVEALLGGISAWHEQAKLAYDGALHIPCRFALVQQLGIMLHNEEQESIATNRGWAVQEWFHLDRLQVVRRTGAHNALTWMLCALGSFRAVVAKNIVVHYRVELGGARDACVVFLTRFVDLGGQTRLKVEGTLHGGADAKGQSVASF